MRPVRRIVITLALLIPSALGPSAWAQSHGHGGFRHHRGPRGPINPVTINPGVGGGYGGYGGYGYAPPLGLGWGPWLPVPVSPLPLAPIAPTLNVGLPVMPPMWQPTADPLIPMMLSSPAANPAPARSRAHDTARMKELIEIGDRLFRVGNFIRAVERYEQARKVDPDKAAPRVRLAQVALVRGKYQDAANLLREAQTAEPGWLATAGDLQAIFPEPAEYAKLVGKLEAHLQSRPEDRDAWLVLGALWYLSGRTQKAADVFLRLSDRKEDPTLRAFLEATKADQR
jgi:hypothetical protein